MTKHLFSAAALDVVGFTTFSDKDQVTIYQKINEIADNLFFENEILKISTGDGFIVTFWGQGPEVALDFVKKFQAQLAQSLLKFNARYAINVGTGMRLDGEASSNIIGNIMNYVCRVMDCGDKGHILMDEKTLKVLAGDKGIEHEKFRVVGFATFKHGEPATIYSYCDGEIGNVSIPKKLTDSGTHVVKMKRVLTPIDFFIKSNNIKILTNAAPFLTDTDFANWLEERLRKTTCQVDVVLVDPESDYAKLRACEPCYRRANELDATVSYTIDVLNGLANQLKKSKLPASNHLNIYLTKSILYQNIWISDTNAMIGNYSPITTGSVGPHTLFDLAKTNEAITSWINDTFNYYLYENSRQII